MPFGISVDIYAMVGEAVYGRGRAGRAKVGRTNNDRGKDLVPQRQRQRQRQTERERESALSYSTLVQDFITFCDKPKKIDRMLSTSFDALTHHDRQLNMF